MPFFTDKFKSSLSFNKQNKSLHKSSGGKETSDIKLNLGGLQTEFLNGQWLQTETNNERRRDKEKELKDQITSLKEEVNLLKLKNEILLDMLADGANNDESD